MSNILLSKDGGVVKRILTEGDASAGQPNTGDSVTVHYVGRLKENDKQFDSSRDRGEPFKFTLGKGEVIKGWDIGVATMKCGEVAELECAPEYAYGAGGQPPSIPPNSTLIFNVELISWEGEDISPDRDGSIVRSIIVKGEQYNCPAEYAPVTAHIVGAHEGRVFYDREVSFMTLPPSDFGSSSGSDGLSITSGGLTAEPFSPAQAVAMISESLKLSSGERNSLHAHLLSVDVDPILVYKKNSAWRYAANPVISHIRECEILDYIGMWRMPQGQRRDVHAPRFVFHFDNAFDISRCREDTLAQFPEAFGATTARKLKMSQLYNIPLAQIMEESLGDTFIVHKLQVRSDDVQPYEFFYI